MNADNIRILSFTEYVRQRPSMYIANTRNGSSVDDGVYCLVQEILENALDEVKNGYGRSIEVSLSPTRIAIRDFGRGIPLEALEQVITIPFSGAKFTGDCYFNSIGLHGLGLKVVSNLSELFSIRTTRNGCSRELSLSRGKLLKDAYGKTSEPNGCHVCFSPDPMIFSGIQFRLECIAELLNRYRATIPQLETILNGEHERSSHGLCDFLKGHIDFSDINGDLLSLGNPECELVLAQCQSSVGRWHSFANGHYNSNGGVHADAAKAALVDAARTLWKGGVLEAADILFGIYGAISVQLPEPRFEAQTKNRLGNVEYFLPWKNQLQNALLSYWYDHIDECEEFFSQIDRNIARRKKAAEAQETVKNGESSI